MVAAEDRTQQIHPPIVRQINWDIEIFVFATDTIILFLRVRCPHLLLTFTIIIMIDAENERMPKSIYFYIALFRSV